MTYYLKLLYYLMLHKKLSPNLADENQYLLFSQFLMDATGQTGSNIIMWPLLVANEAGKLVLYFEEL